MDVFNLLLYFFTATSHRHKKKNENKSSVSFRNLDQYFPPFWLAGKPVKTERFSYRDPHFGFRSERRLKVRELASELAFASILTGGSKYIPFNVLLTFLHRKLQKQKTIHIYVYSFLLTMYTLYIYFIRYRYIYKLYVFLFEISLL